MAQKEGRPGGLRFATSRYVDSLAARELDLCRDAGASLANPICGSLPWEEQNGPLIYLKIHLYW